MGIVVKTRLLITSRKKNAHGGMLSYKQASGDLCRWMKEVANNNYNYNKPKSGAEIAKSIGIDRIMELCPHFKCWIEQLQAKVNV